MTSAASNQYHANMANRYFDKAKNAPGSGGWQAVKGIYHWLRSLPYLFGESDHWTGTVPVDIVPGASFIRSMKGLTDVLKAKALFLRLSPAELKNVTTMLKNLGKDLDNVDINDVYEIERLAKGQFKPSELTPSDYGVNDIGATIKDTNRWAGGTPTRDW